VTAEPAHPNTDRGERRMPLEHLFDAELTYRLGMAPLARHGEGQLVGSGDGSVHGQRVRGRCAGRRSRGGELVCTMNPILAVRTEDGASISIEVGATRAARAGPASCGVSPRRCCSLRTRRAKPGSTAPSGVGRPVRRRPALGPLPRLRPGTRRTAWPVTDLTGPAARAAYRAILGLAGRPPASAPARWPAARPPDDSHRQGRRRASWSDRGRPVAVAAVVIRS
jgi:hypothetical protein